MKIAAVVLVLLAAGWLYYARSRRPAPAPNAAEKYVGGLQNDARRADEAKTKADAAIREMDKRAEEMKKTEEPDAAEPK